MREPRESGLEIFQTLRVLVVTLRRLRVNIRFHLEVGWEKTARCAQRQETSDNLPKELSVLFARRLPLGLLRRRCFCDAEHSAAVRVSSARALIGESVLFQHSDGVRSVRRNPMVFLQAGVRSAVVAVAGLEVRQLTAVFRRESKRAPLVRLGIPAQGEVGSGSAVCLTGFRGVAEETGDRLRGRTQVETVLNHSALVLLLFYSGGKGRAAEHWCTESSSLSGAPVLNERSTGVTRSGRGQLTFLEQFFSSSMASK